MPRMSSEKNGLVMLGTMTPRMRVGLVFSARATALGKYPSSAIARSTRTRAESLTGRVRFTTWETVVKDTPARAATCLMLLNARRSILAGVVGHVVGHLDLAGDDVGLRLVDLLLHVRRDELGVVLVERVVDAVFLQSERDQARLVALRRLVDGDPDALDHRG